MKTFKEFFKYRETFVGIIIAFVFMLVFFCVWMTGYHGVTNRTDHLRIAIVNHDAALGNSIKKSLKKNLPFKVKYYSKKSAATTSMAHRNLDMIITIPKNFTKDIQSTKKPKIEYRISQANASLAKSIMNSAATSITEKINSKIHVYQQQLILKKFSEGLEQKLPQKSVAVAISSTLSSALKKTNQKAVESNIVQPNKAKDFSITMIPLLVLLASFVGSMIMSLNLNTVSSKIQDKFDKWPIFFSKQAINIIMSLVLALFTIILMQCFGVDFKTSIIETGTFEFFVYFSFLCFTQMMLIVFGMGGMLLNILSLSVQLVTSGVLVPKVMLSSFYQAISGYFPASYIADGYMSVLFGGSNRLTYDLVFLLMISAIMFIICVIRVFFVKGKNPQVA
ncbi:hypothetical protein FC19_GL001132 [Liquorilactobacillus aquaticus DSM 21051]|uniref:ABC-2 type transporter transmembrane domain-containing protein n=1 Tax=Liquorilactobacillus aquaticus DSM 21051 TaxID=1423725 RepID=A0A0R2CWX3_9LACO|nr:ABC transporter permease [Liquorilactobacillus aquaticus]KRM96064.1 hypothetical protein FC19_GL001132 [Liquorilactobacillus aquaticus DSM 21051]